MMQKLCNWTTGTRGQLVLGTTLVLIGIHQFNLIPFFSRDDFGSMNLFMGITPLKALGAVATVSGLCLLGACCLPVGGMTGGE
jgi:hypothetical protein